MWEIGIKAAAGELSLPSPFAEAAREVGLQELPISWRHATAAADLPPLHADPFDRVLVAQASLEGLVLLTRDPRVRQYNVATMPA